MADSVYRVTEVVGVSSESWEAAARAAVETAAKSVRDLRVAEVLRQDLTIENGSVSSYRVRLGGNHNPGCFGEVHGIQVIIGHNVRLFGSSSISQVHSPEISVDGYRCLPSTTNQFVDSPHVTSHITAGKDPRHTGFQCYPVGNNHAIIALLQLSG